MNLNTPKPFIIDKNKKGLGNEIEERYKFFSRKKQSNESVDSYIADLRVIAASCNFHDQIHKFIRDVVILNMERHFQKKALQQELSLSEVILLYRQNCIDVGTTKKIFNDSNLSVNAKPGCSADTKDISGKSIKVSDTKSTCWRCSTSHPPRGCPAWGKLCEDCNELHHLTENCNKVQRYSQSYFCKKCGTSHRYKQCPAFGAICTKCLKSNHYSSQCVNESVINHFDNCDWCGSMHLPDECPHDEACPNCAEYPHNICFQCRQNPHIPSCIFKELINLPMLKENVEETKCAWCGSIHPGAHCPHDANCSFCYIYPHKLCFECKQSPHAEFCKYSEDLSE